MPFLCRFTKKGRKKGNPGVPPGNPLHPAGLLWPSGVLPLQTSSICVAYIPPRRWVSRARLFAFPSCLNFRQSRGKRQKLSFFAKAESEQLPCRCFSLKHRRKSRSCLLLRRAARFISPATAHALGVLRGSPLSAFSSPILCGKAKNRHRQHSERARSAV